MKKRWQPVNSMRKAMYFMLSLFFSCSSQHAPYTVEKTSISNAGIELAADIYKPNGNGPFPAVVIVHGSKNNTKDDYTEYSGYFAAHGIVTVNYDKRGNGGSTGNLYTSTFEDLASDVTAVADYVRRQPYVDSARVGLWADSQGGWIILIADSLSNQFSFLINKSGPVMTPLQQILYDYNNNYDAVSGAPEEVTGELNRWYEQVFEYLTRSRTDSLWQGISKVIEKYEPTPYLKQDHDKYYLSILGPPRTMKPRREIVLGPAGRNYDFDPIPYLRQLETPMLYFIGTADKLNDVDACVSNMRRVNNPNITLHVVDGTDHGMQLHRWPDLLFKPAFPDGYLKLQVIFIQSGSETVD